jgi:hypothetical protein
MIYPSKKDSWLILVVVGSGLALAGAAVYNVAECGFDHPAALILIGITAFYGTIIRGLAYPVTYEIKPPDLIIKSGLVTSRIVLESIEAVRPTRNPLSAPAWSLDRIRIDYRKGGHLSFALISPENKEAFLEELVHRTSGLERRKDRVARVSGAG